MARAGKPPTLVDVARLAGVSVPSASRALNGGVRGVQSGSSEVRKRVTDAARALGYVVSPAAQATKGGRARTVALVVSDIEDFGSAALISGVMHAAEMRGASVAVRATGDDPKREAALLTHLAGERHRAVIIGTSRTTDQAREAQLASLLQTLHERGTRVVVIGDNDMDFPTVTVDNRRAARRLAAELAATGARRFALASGPDQEITAHERVTGFLEGLAEHGLAVAQDDIVQAPFSRDGGYAAVDRISSDLSELDVIAAMSDAMAVGIIARLRELGIGYPGPVEVTGFDHVPMLGDVLPEFSTVEVPLKAFGRAALTLALDEQDVAGEISRIALRAIPIVHGIPLRPLSDSID
ncbi:LacI family DNA-binding transcriptional regulator [Microbacterium sp. 22195]|uniref:LacI family DNA-binding transcriptional regulator n=1 Tax=Microbacterium sp. 22195 TaxID=3453891 RepID=UPI003F8714CE